MTTPDDITARIAALRAEIADRQAGIDELPQSSPLRKHLNADLTRLRAELASLETGDVEDERPINVDQSAQSGGNNAGAGNTFGDNTHIGDVLAQHHYYGAEATDVVPLLRAYLSEITGVCSRLSLADADSIDPHQAALDLQSVYVGLEVPTTVDLPPPDLDQLREEVLAQITQSNYTLEDLADITQRSFDEVIQALIDQATPKERQRRLRATEVLAANRLLVLIGDPGSGKSSFVNFITICLAGAWRGESTWLDHLGADWPHGARIPVRVVLREFAAWIGAQAPRGYDDAALFWHWLEHGAGMAKLLVQHLRAAFADDRVLLLFDGLDEVPFGSGNTIVRQVVSSIDTLSKGGGRCLVTCRVLDYQRPERQLTGWPVEQIAPLAQPLCEQLIDRWFGALERLNRPTRGAPSDLRDGLKLALQTRPELQRLAGNPLLLTMMARLQAHDGELPGERVALYRRSVELLLLHWRRDAAGRSSLAEQLQLSQWSESLLNQLLDRLAYAAHERGVSGDSEQGADLPRQVLIDTAAAFFARYDPEQDLVRAQTFLSYISRHGNGIIQQHDQQIYRFPHRTFQEYLAGRRLTSDEGWPNDGPEFVDRALACSARGAQWREAIVLAISQYAINGQIRPAINLAEEVLTRFAREGSGRDGLLAAEIVLEVGRARVDERWDGVWPRVRAALLTIIQRCTPDDTAAFPVAERVRAGFLLANFDDQRVPITLEQWQETCVAFAGGIGSYWCRVEAGTYTIGSSPDDSDAYEDEQPQHEVTLEHSYWIAQVPITNAQWQTWVDAGGQESYYADDSDLNHPNQP
ncbi:MAG: SUMF1/EgtB/PvdO family nonheme iron enzyme, partial [Blastochloris sp.]|nr:SUMF1/EgtB/PvdO family nonheme iron enzyme [Blastochloris sp.]